MPAESNSTVSSDQAWDAKDWVLLARRACCKEFIAGMYLLDIVQIIFMEP